MDDGVVRMLEHGVKLDDERLEALYKIVVRFHGPQLIRMGI